MELESRMTVWYGMVWYGMVWYGMVWYGMVWFGNQKKNINMILKLQMSLNPEKINLKEKRKLTV